VSEMLRTLLAPNASPMTLDGTRTFLVGRERPVVIDPGPAVAAHLDAIVDALGGATPSAILLTHGHPDHAGAAPALRERTGAPVMMAAGALSLPIPAESVDRWIGTGHLVETDAGYVQAVATPGHAPEHLAFLWRGAGEASGERALFVGDLMMGVGDTTLVMPPEGDLRSYLQSLAVVATLGPRVILPAHGPAIDDPNASVARYVSHREQRVAQAAEALARCGPAHPGDLVLAVYGSALHPELRPAAEGSLTAILSYLARTGRAAAAPDGTYTLVERT
jgi:glyoxylase-like metal-dependent hydrolase (beta-lactamase superfamily II)